MFDPAVIAGFEWDAGNSEKIRTHHDIRLEEVEQLFLNSPLLVSADPVHSTSEQRYCALGATAPPLPGKLFWLSSPCEGLNFGYSAPARPTAGKGECMKSNNLRVKPATATEAQGVDWTRAQRVVFPNLKPTAERISLKVPGFTLAEIRRLAHHRGVSAQGLMNFWLAEKVREEAKAP